MILCGSTLGTSSPHRPISRAANWEMLAPPMIPRMPVRTYTVHTYERAHTHKNTHACTSAHAHARTRTHTHAHAHTHTHTHTHTMHARTSVRRQRHTSTRKCYSKPSTLVTHHPRVPTSPSYVFAPAPASTRPIHTLGFSFSCMLGFSFRQD